MSFFFSVLHIGLSLKSFICRLLNKIFTYLFLVVLALLCCIQAFSRCGEWGLLSSCGAQASHGGFASPVADSGGRGLQ